MHNIQFSFWDQKVISLYSDEKKKQLLPQKYK